MGRTDQKNKQDKIILFVIKETVGVTLCFSAFKFVKIQD